MIRSLQLRAKNLALSRASAIARASPLMGAAWFSSISEAAPNKCYFPACTAAEGLNGWTLTVFLRWPLTNVILWPVSGQASQFGFIKYADTLFNFADDHRFSWWNDVLVAAKMVSCVWCKQMHMITGLWVQTTSLLCWQGLESGGWRQDIMHGLAFWGVILNPANSTALTPKTLVVNGNAMVSTEVKPINCLEEALG